MVIGGGVEHLRNFSRPHEIVGAIGSDVEPGGNIVVQLDHCLCVNGSGEFFHFIEIAVCIVGGQEGERFVVVACPFLDGRDYVAVVEHYELVKKLWVVVDKFFVDFVAEKIFEAVR